jgi:hypothetical protein
MSHHKYATKSSLLLSSVINVLSLASLIATFRYGSLLKVPLVKNPQLNYLYFQECNFSFFGLKS